MRSALGVALSYGVALTALAVPVVGFVPGGQRGAALDSGVARRKSSTTLQQSSSSSSSTDLETSTIADEYEVRREHGMFMSVVLMRMLSCVGMASVGAVHGKRAMDKKIHNMRDDPRRDVVLTGICPRGYDKTHDDMKAEVRRPTLPLIFWLLVKSRGKRLVIVNAAACCLSSSCEGITWLSCSLLSTTCFAGQFLFYEIGVRPVEPTIFYPRVGLGADLYNSSRYSSFVLQSITLLGYTCVQIYCAYMIYARSH